MYVLDISVASALLKPAEGEVVSWLRRQLLPQLYLTSTVVYEIARGIERMPAGRKRRALVAMFEADFLPLFADRILPLDTRAARIWASLAAAGEKAGRVPPIFDCQIAAVAIRHDMTVVTLDRRGFEPLGCRILDPSVS